MSSELEYDAGKFEKSSPNSNISDEIQQNNEKESTASNDINYFYNLEQGNKMAYIFNNHDFSKIREKEKEGSEEKKRKIDEETLTKDREGSEHDFKRIQKCLRDRQFVVNEYQDKTFNEIQSEIKKASKQKRCDVSCIIIVVMTHGGTQNTLKAFDKEYKINRLTDLFYQNPTELAGVPKLFFIQACRGGKKDINLEYFDGDDGTHEPSLPTHANFLFMYSTIEDHVSIRDCRKGTWFIQELCNQIENNYKDYDLLGLLTLVNHAVAIRITTGGHKQMPQIVSTLTKFFKFT